jgi:hypothetical protein
MMEYDAEPIRGLPGRLPRGEHIIWQGAPDWLAFARGVFHVRILAGYFALLAMAGLASGSIVGAIVTLAVGAIGIGLFALLAWASARTTVYTLTNRRMVLRVGVAIPKCFNLPLALIGAADLRAVGRGHGDIALTMLGEPRFGYLLLWPHARPWRYRSPQPMLRAVPEPDAVAAKLMRACAALVAIQPAIASEPVRLGAAMPVGAAA